MPSRRSQQQPDPRNLSISSGAGNCLPRTSTRRPANHRAAAPRARHQGRRNGGPHPANQGAGRKPRTKPQQRDRGQHSPRLSFRWLGTGQTS
eukprot:3790688-Pyramimonas_sp.AAC.1